MAQVTKTFKTEYHYVEGSGSARINFVNGTFDGCTYSVPSNRSQYTLDDWKFLQKLSSKVVDLSSKQDITGPVVEDE